MKINFDQIGTVLLVKSRRAKSINFTIAPFEGVRVSVPRTISYEKAIKAVHSKKEWIKKHLPQIKATEASLMKAVTGSRYATKKHKLMVQKWAGNDPKISVASGKIKVNLPATINAESEEGRALIREGLEQAWRNEAQEYLPGRLTTLAAKHGFRFRSLRIKNMRTRWGSCSFANNISLSLHLMRLPYPLIDYVLLHELVHTRIKNHSKAFWKRLDQLTGDAKAQAVRLRMLSRQVW